MRNTIIALAAAAPLLVAASLETSTSGGAKIINKCDYDIPMEAVPASGEDVDEATTTSKTLAANNAGDDSEYFTNWISLGDDGGWSLKLNANNSWTNIMQYEYTWTGDSDVWYDMSFVNGDSSDFPEWEFIAGDGEATTNAYLYSTDDAEGMNPAVATSVTVTLILCPASTGSATEAATSATSFSSSPAAATTTATSTTTSAYKAPSSSSTTLATSYSKVQFKDVVQSTSAAATTTAAPAPINAEYEVVTEYATEVVTAVVYETAHAKAKRHEHRHPHAHHA